MARNLYTDSGSWLNLGNVGQLQVLDIIPVIAGSSLGVRANGVVRLSPLRRPLSMDSRLDIVAFYVPHRHVYGESFKSLIQEGVDHTTTVAGITLTEGIECLPGLSMAGTVAKWSVVPYNQIWNRYIRDPRDTYTVGEEALPGAAAVKGTSALNCRKYGYPVAHLPHVTNTGNREAVADADKIYELTVSGSKVKIDMPTLDQMRARYNTEEERSWFHRRYADIMQANWGTQLNLDADQRPRMDEMFDLWMSGYDVDGTGDANLGSFTGKAFAKLDFRLHRMFYPEHGSVWIMCVMRFPPVFKREHHYLQRIAQPTYKQIAGDAEVMAAEPPQDHNIGDFITDGANNVSIGRHPYGQWYRTHPSRVHPDYEEIAGFPLRDAPATYDEGMYKWSDYETIFANLSLRHWQVSAMVQYEFLNNVPRPKTSIYIGE